MRVPQADEAPQLTYGGLRYALGVIAEDIGEHAGIPVPISDCQLVIEPTYRHADVLSKIGVKEPDLEKVAAFDAKHGNIRLRNVWYSHRWRCDIWMIEREDGKVEHCKSAAIHSLGQQLQTLGCWVAWGIEQETTALELLRSLVKPHQFEQYFLTGSFLESSPRSGVTYMFRKLRPTVAMVARPGLPKQEESRGLCTLCMHPIAYYNGSWAGGMCPTDDVIAHLMLMRADERLFWARSNQHPMHRPEAGL